MLNPCIDKLKHLNHLKHGLHFIIGAMLMAHCILLNPVFAKDVVIALSPYHSDVESREQHALTLLDYIVSLEPGDQAYVIDGYHLSTVAAFTIPTDPRYSGKKPRIHANRKAVAGLLGFAKHPLSAGGADVPLEGAVKLPELLRYIAHNIQTDALLEVVVIGSALYHDPLSPVFSMTDNRVPGDGHLDMPLKDTPFGTAGMAGLLKGARLHLAYTDAEAQLGGRYRDIVRRFWTLYVEALGGKLVTFERQPADALHNIRRGAKAPAHSYQREETDKLEMMQYRPVQLDVSQSIFERPVSNTPLSSEQVRRADHLEIGISWTCSDCDLDLYAMAYPGADILYFGHTESAQGGQYWKDYTNSPKTVNGFETISYPVPLDLRAVSVAINFYQGSSPSGVTGEVRIAVGAQTYAAPFRIEAANGIGGVGVKEIIKAGHSTRPETLIVDLLTIVGAVGANASS